MLARYLDLLPEAFDVGICNPKLMHRMELNQELSMRNNRPICLPEVHEISLSRTLHNHSNGRLAFLENDTLIRDRRSSTANLANDKASSTQAQRLRSLRFDSGTIGIAQPLVRPEDKKSLFTISILLAIWFFGMWDLASTTLASKWDLLDEANPIA